MIARGMRYAEPSSRVRVRLGRLLNARDYASLVLAPTPEQMLAQLRTTNYAQAFQAGGPSTYSFADVLHQHHLASAERMISFLPSSAGKVCRTFLLHFAIGSLKVILRTAGSAAERPRLARLLGPLPPESGLPLERLIGATSLHDVVNTLSETPYAEPLQAAIHQLPAHDASPSALLFSMELQLDRWFFERLWLASRSLPGGDSRVVLRLVGTLADVTNILWERRLRETFQLSPEDVGEHLVPFGFHLTDRKRGALVSWDVDRPLPSPFQAAKSAAADLRIRLLRLLCREASRPLFMVPFQAGLPLALLLLADMEVSDLITLYEGKRWALPPQELASRLIRFHGDAAMHS